MIAFIENKQQDKALDIRRVFQDSYKIEAELLGAVHFPPLSRRIEAFYNCPNDFVGYYEDHKLVAVIEMKKEVSSMHIQSLVVDPDYFRRGIARKLIQFVLEYYTITQFTVETGRDNGPARKLYEGFGFVLEKTYNAAENITKVRYQIKL
ncbi:GNAT family N-acetyltransferase [Crocinitomicaceae bacterium]|nr:GNAT family N-acetyltransferase [Crocinitomicaceae bacterium]